MRLRFAGAAAVVAAVLLVYSQTLALAWDEGYHLLAAQLVKAGKTLYIDFCFPQTPLNTYWNAGWMGILGERWRALHAVAALTSLGATLLAASFLWVRFPVPGWRGTAAFTGVALIGLNALVVQFGTIGQPYALCLILLVAAFRVAVIAVERKSPLAAGLAGLCAGCAASSSMLTVTAGPALLIWTLVYNRAGDRWKKGVALAAGEAVAFVPLLWLLARNPGMVWFSVIQYQLLFRHVGWEGGWKHDFQLMVMWLDSADALLSILLALYGLWFVVYRSGWDRARRAEFYLCGWLAAAIGGYLSLAVHPAFRQYFIFAVPFVIILASAGLYRLAGERRALVYGLVALVALALVKRVVEKNDYSWMDLEGIAAKVDQVTPPGAPMVADEQIYFLTGRRPPSGMELADSHKLDFPPERATPLHLLSEKEVVRRIQAGEYATVQSCGAYDSFDEVAKKRYAKSAQIEECHIYWERR